MPAEPNYSGSFKVAAHSGPWEPEQSVPLVLYGPGFIKAQGTVEEPASVTDLYATVGRLTKVALEERPSRVLKSALEPAGDRIPKLVVVVVWDGAGRGVLDRWEGRWPNLARLTAEGTSFVNATVGSSPSITPATHSNLGTGAFPRSHGVTAIVMRTEEGIRNAFAARDPKDLKLTTFADQIDAAYGNASEVGMVAWKSWHMGMLSHGSAVPGGDPDDLALIGKTSDVTGNDDFYTTPSFSDADALLAEAVDKLDRKDGQADDEWRGQKILEEHDNPAWPEFEKDITLQMLASEGYGQDDVPDIFVTNYKSSDLVAHELAIASEELGEVIEAQDAALGELVAWLDENVEDYVVALTADHGFPPPAEETKAWPLQQGELQRDVDAHFKVDEGSLIKQTTAVGPFLDREAVEQAGVTETEIAEFLNGYTIRENYADGEALPKGYETRGDELILSAAFPSADLDQVMDCAFSG